MPFRKTYQINNREQGKAAQRDQSYRSCLIALLIFFFMCLILILACKPWKVQNQREYREPYIKHDSQHYPQERTKETTIMTVSLTTSTTTSTTQKTPTEETILARTWIIPVNTSTAENRPTEEINVITEDYSKKNVKGSHHFERYFENTTSIDEITLSTPVSQKSIEDYISNEILENVETTEESIGLTTLPYDITTDNVINNATSISSSGSIGVTTKYTSIVDIIKNIMSSTTKEFISDSIDEYYSSDKSEVDIVTNNVITSTLLTQSNDTEENVSENSKKYERLRVGIDNITFSTTPSLPTDLEESTSAKYSSIKNNYSETLQFEVTTSNILTRSDSQENEDTGNSTTKDLNYEESAVTNENETRENSPSTINYTSLMDEKFSTKVKSEAEDLMNETITSIKSYTTEKFNLTSDGMEKYNESSTSNYINTTTTIFYNHTTRTAIPVSYNETDLITTGWTTLSNEDTSICGTGLCKQIASRMLSYMNHSADPCDDFYEYACGSFEANPQLIDGDLIRRSRNYQRIANQMLKEKHENVRSTFATYYDSCVQYEGNMNFNERIAMANDALRKIGKFYISDTWSDNYMGFTNLFAQLMLHHSALLFDVVPELDEYRRNNFTLKIGPTTYESPFKVEYVEDPCSEDTFETEGQYVDLEILYHNYEKCKNDTSEFMRSIRKTLKELNVFKGLNDSDLEWSIQSENIEKTVHVIDSVVMQEYFSNFPSKSEIREAYLMNDYSKVSLEDLQSSSTFVNWAQLIHLLTGVHVESNEIIQVYFHAALTKGLRKLEKYAEKNSMNLNNAIMALYANKLYHELVLPKHDNVKDYCLHVATYLLRLEASSLYVSSFTDYEITQMNVIIKKTFNNLKQTLSDKMQEAQWAKEEGRKELLNKINDLKLALPVVSYFKNRNSLYNEYNVSEVILNDNYFNNSMMLLKRYRILMYTELRREVGGPKQIWTYYATPFQSKAQVIYALNLIVIPYGIIDWALMSDLMNGDELSYFLLATLGNLIAHQIAHHFDTNGIHYWNQIRNAQDSLMFENEFTNTHFDDYINCQKENLYQEPIDMTLPFTDQIVSFRIPRLTLNERLSEIIGLRLAYDTLALTMSNAKRLPWIQLRIDQLFYLAYAQMYCTKTSLTSSYVSLHESENLPSRIRVFVSASNDKLLAKAWNCPLGSQIAPNDVCNVFPYIEIKETSMIPE
ncbi:PREDICTED: membrane metallo-endopeptidase-like 1 [Trachymyrmex cornetzi]|uniref:Endothelin-converting enzyme 2 n=1 Tax=Trachymyrmex cornetzi TaxID=471704 RepID=A0A195DTH9_9HYME|nr:PREDICTED: membrane metallo-endopeptidase-like 1 [Trachymyrmex cornetzi]KYN15849.1 Endothelin-converting enzyme 2 [Trachymyrmex cornetzi]